MAQVIVRNIEDEVIGVLKARAAVKGISLEEELRGILRAAATPSPEELVVLADRVRELTPGVDQWDSTDLVREDRDR